MASGGGLGEKGLVKAVEIQGAAFELGPGVVIGVGGVDGADEILGDAVFRFEAVKRLEGAAREHAPEVPKDRFKFAHD